MKRSKLHVRIHSLNYYLLCLFFFFSTLPFPAYNHAVPFLFHVKQLHVSLSLISILCRFSKNFPLYNIYAVVNCFLSFFIFSSTPHTPSVCVSRETARARYYSLSNSPRFFLNASRFPTGNGKMVKGHPLCWHTDRFRLDGSADDSDVRLA